MSRPAVLKDDPAFREFVTEKSDNLRRIAAATRGEMTLLELHGAAWLMAHDLSLQLGRKIDFAALEDRDLILRALHVRHIKRSDWKLKRALRLDLEPDGEEGGATWKDRLAAAPRSDPLALLEFCEDMAAEEQALSSSYSQAAAYVVILARFGDDREKVCAWLVISPSTLYARERGARETVSRQPSLFDGVESIADDFMPLAGRQYAHALIVDVRQTRQERLAF